MGFEQNEFPIVLSVTKLSDAAFYFLLLRTDRVREGLACYDMARESQTFYPHASLIRRNVVRWNDWIVG